MDVQELVYLFDKYLWTTTMGKELCFQRWTRKTWPLADWSVNTKPEKMAIMQEIAPMIMSNCDRTDYHEDSCWGHRLTPPEFSGMRSRKTVF